MHEFFRGGRRKAGVVTLVLACVFMALWSLEQLDREPEVTFSVSGDGIRLEYWCWNERLFSNLPQKDPAWEWQGFQFEEGLLPFGNQKLVRWKIPCWFVALSFSLLSAFLLLSKPRPAKSLEPAQTDGA